MIEKVQKLGRRAEWWVPATFALFSGLWIYFSDALVASISLGMENQRVISTYKGFAYVLIATILLYMGIRTALRRERAEARKAVEAQKFTDQIIHSVQEGVIVYGPDLRYQVWNPFMEQLSGIPAKDVIGKHPLEVFPFLQESGAMDHVNRALTGEQVDPIEFPFHVPSTGRKGWNIDASAPFRNAQGEIVGVLATVTDITERRQAEDKLTHSHELMRYIIEHNQGAVAVHDRDMKYIYVSQQYLKDYKVEDQDIIGRHHYEVMPDLPQKWRDVHQAALAGVVSSADGDEWPRADGTVEWTRWECRPWYEADGSIGGIIVYTELVSARKRAERALLESENRLKKAQQVAHVGSWTWNVKANHLEWSDEMYNIFGIKKEHFHGLLSEVIAQAIHPDDCAALEQSNHSALQHSKPVSLEYRVIRPDGTERMVWAEAGEPIVDESGSSTILTGIVQDITDRKQAQAVLKASEEKYRTLIDNLSSGLVVHGPDSSILLANEMASALLGLSEDQMLGKTAIDSQWCFLQEDGSPMPLDLYPVSRVLSTNEGFRGQVIGVCRPDRAAPVWVLCNAYAVKDAADQIAQAVITFSDITALKQAEAALRESEERWKFAIEGAGDGLWDWNVQTGGAYFSPHYKEMYGYAEGDIGTSSDEWSKRIHPDDAPGVFAALQPYLEGKPGHVAVEFRMLCKDGSWRWTLGRGMVVQRDECGKPLRMIGTNSDITNRKQAEVEKGNLQNKLLQSQKMESLGTLAGGVAHDMNNVLGAILGMASANMEAQPTGSPAHRAFDTITQAAMRGGKMVRSLLNFARQSPMEEYLLDMNAVLLDELAMLERTTLGRVRIELDLAEHLRPVRGDAAALTHAFMNLCINALDAMPEGGVLTLQTRNADPDWIEVVVADTGVGMPREVLDRAMDPFFTTKGVGKGTGLGLAMVYKTVQSHRGQMELVSEPGQGTSVRLRFPACEASIPETRSEAAIFTEPAHLALEVLVVDDDELIQSSLLTMLELMGHRPEGATTGEEALAMLEAGLEPDLVILDMNMPGLGGAETLPRLRTLRPKLPVLLSTGRTDQTALALASAHPWVTLLPKPFGLDELQKSIKRMGMV